MVLWSLGSAASKLRRISWIYLESGTVARRRTFDKQNSNRLDLCVRTHIRHYTTNIQEWSWYCEVECWNWMKSESLYSDYSWIINYYADAIYQVLWAEMNERFIRKHRKLDLSSCFFKDELGEILDRTGFVKHCSFSGIQTAHWQEPGEEIPLRSGWWRGGHWLQSAASWRSRFHL